MPDTQVTTADWSTSLIELLQEQHSLVDELASLAQQQSQLIEGARTDELLALLTRRQRIVDRFASTQDELGQLTENLEARIQTLSEGQRTNIQSLLGSIGERLSEVMQRDEEDQQALQAASGQARENLASFDASRQARQAYLSGKAVNNRFADQRG